MLKLVTLPAAFGMRNVSPFCLKIEMLLTALNLPFTMTELADPRQAPKGKLPFLYDGEHCIADSELITEYLDQKTGGQVYAGLSPQQIARGVALSRLAEDHLYWIMVASRWLDDEWWPNIVSDFFGFVPALIRPIPTTLARRQVRQTYHYMDWAGIQWRSSAISPGATCWPWKTACPQRVSCSAMNRAFTTSQSPP